MSIHQFTTRLGDLLQVNDETGEVVMLFDREEARGRVFMEPGPHGIYFSVPDYGGENYNLIDLYPEQMTGVPTIRVFDPVWDDPIAEVRLGERTVVAVDVDYARDQGLDEWRMRLFAMEEEE